MITRQDEGEAASCMELLKSDGARECEIWAIAGGKGGTGKSFVTSSLGFSLAATGRRVVMLDADLGGPNLHSFLGVGRPGKSLSDFFDSKTPLREVIKFSGHENVWLITGDVNTLDSNNVKYTQKQKLFRHIKQTEADYMLIDLGSGSHSNVIDTFLQADKMVVVLVPEVTAIENMYHFLKNVFYRKLKMTLTRGNGRDVVQAAWARRQAHGFSDLKGLVDYLIRNHPDLEPVLRKLLGEFKVNIVLNRIRSPKDVKIGVSIRSILMKCFGFETRYSGYVDYDEMVLKTTNARKPFMVHFPASSCAKEINDLRDNILGNRQVRMLT